MSPSGTVVVGWVSHHTRNEGLAHELGGTTVYPIWGPRGSAFIAPLRYVVQGVMTVAALARLRPSRVIVMLPPFPILAICLAYARITGATVIGDVHTYPLVASVWRPFLPLTAWLLRRGAGAIVTNEANASILRERGVPTIVMHDTPRLVPGRDEPVQLERPRVVVPASFDPDEPIAAILGAAALLPDVEFVITGQDNRGVLDDLSVPGNVTIPGFLARSDYETLLREATVVCSLTTLENCMQQAGYEALGFGRPFVTSDQAVLREYFGDAARYAAPEPTELAAALRSAIGDGPELHARMVDLGQERVAQRSRELSLLETVLAGGGPPTGTDATQREMERDG